ncbi:MAG: chorismate mutase [Ignavibacteriaceae bacterium]|nr:chorismate mutase [Ignavibacteriaceae bacterium]
MRTENKLKKLRDEVNLLDDKIISLLIERLEKSMLIGKLKKELSVESYTPVREKEILNRITSMVVDDELRIHAKRIFERIIDESRAVQRKIKL